MRTRSSKAETSAAIELLEQFSQAQRIASAQGKDLSELLAAVITQGISIPATEFASDRTPLETIAVFLATTGYKTSEISAATKRPSGTITHALQSARKKKPATKQNRELPYNIPVSVMHDTRISPAEAVIAYLREHYALPNITVANILGRDQRNTWQLYKSACKKREVRT